MKKILTKILAIALICVITLTSMGAYGGEYDGKESVLFISGALNEMELAKINIQTPANYKYDLNEVRIQLNKYNDDSFEVIGEIERNGEVQPFKALGNMLEVSLDVGKNGLIGNLLGNIVVNGIIEHFNLTVHCIPSEDELYAYITIGMLSNEKDIETLIYGEYFEGMNELVNNFRDNSINVNEVVETSLNTKNSTYNTGFRNMTTERVYVKGVGYDLMAVSLYAPETLQFGKVMDAYVKVNSNEKNAEKYVEEKYFPTYNGTADVWTTSSTCSIGTVDNHWNMTDLKPETTSNSFTLNIPYIGNNPAIAFAVANLTFNINLSSIKAEAFASNG